MFEELREKCESNKVNVDGLATLTAQITKEIKRIKEKLKEVDKFDVKAGEMQETWELVV